jgi:NAD(P)-dependent dehydrogenase (short-subunit alcohol dehydrogenase family)
LKEREMILCLLGPANHETDSTSYASDEVAGMVSYLASAESSFVTGADVLIDGSFVA